jgi:pimeloyl-ACP methyl ester carboxylesterase
VPITAAHRGTAESRAALAYFQALPPVAHRSNLCDASSPQAQGLGARVGQPLRVFVCCGMADPVLGEPVMRKLADKLWGASTGYHWHAVEEGGHFVQEVRCVHAISPPL